MRVIGMCVGCVAGVIHACPHRGAAMEMGSSVKDRIAALEDERDRLRAGAIDRDRHFLARIKSLEEQLAASRASESRLLAERDLLQGRLARVGPNGEALVAAVMKLMREGPGHGE